MITVTRRFKADIGHRLLNHEGKCSHIHGHEYKFLVTVQCSGLNELGMVIDFSVVKEIVGGWIDSSWDHGFIVKEADFVVRDFLNAQRFKYYVMSENPTAENIAVELWKKTKDRLAEAGVWVVSIEVQETENCKAVFTP